MTMSSKDSWRELAELLGLPTDEPPPQSAKPEPAPAPAPAPVAEIERDDVDDDPLPASLAEPGPIERDDDDDEFFIPPIADDSSDDLDVPDFEAVTLETQLDEEIEGGPLPESDGPKSEEDKPREGRRRRRGRRGRRRGGDEGEPGTQAEAPEGVEVAVDDETETVPVGDAGSSEGDDEPRGRRRGRRPVGEAEAATAVEDGDEAPHGSSDEGDDFSQDAWADWNVPLWQELIDGLYRPDRDR